jgi:hypothetical protein
MVLDDMQLLMSPILAHVSNQHSDETIKFQAMALSILNRMETLSDRSSLCSALVQDHIYRSVLLAALIYCRSITSRLPLSRTCSLVDLNNLWASMWRVNLSRWKEIPGIFLFVILAAIPERTPHGRFLKSMLKTTTAYLSLGYWDVVDCTLMTYVELQRWLRDDTPDMVVAEKEVKPLNFVHFYRQL